VAVEPNTVAMTGQQLYVGCLCAILVLCYAEPQQWNTGSTNQNQYGIGGTYGSNQPGYGGGAAGFGNQLGAGGGNSLAPFNPVYEWFTLDYNWPDEMTKGQAISNRRFVPENNAIAGIKAWRDRVFVSIPRWKEGVPVTLASLPAQPLQPNGSPRLEPFPSWQMQEIGNCSALQFVQNVEIDTEGKIWILDSGRTNILDPAANTLPSRCPPKLVIIDLNSVQFNQFGGGFGGQPGYPNQQYPNQGGVNNQYPGQSGYNSQYPNNLQPGQPGYNAQYPNNLQPGQPGYNSQYPNNPQPGQPGYNSQYPNNLQPGQPGYNAQYPNNLQPGQPGYNSQYPNNPLPGQPGYNSQYPNNLQPGQPGYNAQYPNNLQPGQPGYNAQYPNNVQPGQPGYNAQYPNNPQPGQPGYNSQYPNNQYGRSNYPGQQPYNSQYPNQFNNTPRYDQFGNPLNQQYGQGGQFGQFGFGNNFRIVKMFNFPSNVATQHGAYLKDIVLDNSNGWYAYITDHGDDPGIIVYSFREDRAWKVKDARSMRSDPDVGFISINNIDVELRGKNIDGIALSPASGFERTVYFSPLGSYNLYSVPTSVLKNANLPSDISSSVVDLGRKQSITDGMTMDNRGNLYFGLLGLNAVGVWNTKHGRFTDSQRILARDNRALQWPGSFTIDDMGSLWVVTNRQQNYLTGRVNTNEPNYRILKAPIGGRNYMAPADLSGGGGLPVAGAGYGGGAYGSGGSQYGSGQYDSNYYYWNSATTTATTTFVFVASVLAFLFVR